LNQLRVTKTLLKPTRIENAATPGVPDVIFFDQKGLFHFVELKFTNSNKVNLSPHQVSWISTHSAGSVWVLVKKQPDRRTPKEFEIFLFHGRDVVDLRMDGLDKVEPAYHGHGADTDWREIFRLISGT